MIHHMGGGADLSGVGVMGNAGFLNLDMNGKRFMNEDLPGQQLENQVELQKNRESWQIFDSNWPEQLPYMPAAHGGACYYEDYASETDGPKNNATYRNYKSPYQLEAAVADGRAVKADTLKELVAKIYPDDTAAQQTALESMRSGCQLQLFLPRRIYKKAAEDTVHVVVGSLQFQLTTKNEIGNPFRGSLSHFFVGAILQQPPFYNNPALQFGRNA